MLVFGEEKTGRGPVNCSQPIVHLPISPSKDLSPFLMTSSSFSSLLVPKDSNRKLPSPAGDMRYPFPSFTTSPLPVERLTRSETYFGLTATRKSSVKLA